MNLHSNYPGQCVDLQTIAVQTFLIIWRHKYLNRTISIIVMSLELIFIVLFIGITFGIHTHPKEKYFAAPVPVCVEHLLFCLCNSNVVVLVLDRQGIHWISVWWGVCLALGSIHCLPGHVSPSLLIAFWGYQTRESLVLTQSQSHFKVPIPAQ